MILEKASIKTMDPVGEQIIDKIDDRADSPGQRVYPIDISDFMSQMHDDDNISDPKAAPDDEHNTHWEKCFSGAAADGRNRVGKSKQTVKQRDGASLSDTQLNYALSPVEQADQLWSKKIVAYTDNLGQDNGSQNAETGAFFGAVMLSGTKILADKCCACRIEACNRQKSKAFDFGVRAIGRHSQLTERIDLRLHNYIGKTDYRVLDA